MLNNKRRRDPPSKAKGKGRLNGPGNAKLSGDDEAKMMATIA